MVERGLLGNKTKGGFYKKQKGEGDKREIWTLDTATLDYRPSEKVKLPSLDMAKNIERRAGADQGVDLGQGSRRRISVEDTFANAYVTQPSEFRKLPTRWLKSIARCVGALVGSLGPFEVWDAIGVEKSVARMKEEGMTVPANVEQMLASGATSFYKKENGQQFYFDFALGKYVPLADQPGVLILKSIKDQKRRHQEECRRFVDRSRRRRCLSRVSLEDECDRRRHAADVEVCARRS